VSELRVLIVDDEPLARRRLVRMLGGIAGAECIGEAGNGSRAVEMIRQLEPDVVLLDIEMPGLDGLTVVERAARPVQVIFTTAYEQYAVKAFELQAADYLLKPFGVERLEAALDRAAALLEAGAQSTTPILFARDRGRIVPLAADRVTRLEADGAEHLVGESLQNLHERLGDGRFVRVHRSRVVNLEAVAAFEPIANGRMRVRMKDGAEVVASRRGGRLIRARLG
jgi:DNA-binding LytR/AlgR family response regulator